MVPEALQSGRKTDTTQDGVHKMEDYESEDISVNV